MPLKITCTCGFQIGIQKHEVKLEDKTEGNSFAGIKCPKCKRGIGIFVFSNDYWDIGKIQEIKKVK